jgi:hypothetical protein
MLSRRCNRTATWRPVASADWPADFGGDGARGASDHDPVVSRFELSSGDDDD